MTVTLVASLGISSVVSAQAADAARRIVGLCGFLPPEDPKKIAELTASFEGPALATQTNKALAARLAQNTADRAIAAPLLIAQGLADSVVLPAVTEVYVDERCVAGQSLEYWTFGGLDHGTIVRPGTWLEEPLMAWTKSRLSNDPAPSGCVRRSF